MKRMKHRSDVGRSGCSENVSSSIVLYFLEFRKKILRTARRRFNPQVSHCRRYQDCCYFLHPHGLTTATVSSWVHLILSYSLSRKYRTLLQDLFSWHPVTTTQHLSWKNCTGFPFQNILSIKSLVCVSVL